MSKRSRRALAAGIVLVAFSVTGAGFPTERATPKAWTGEVCTAITDWQAVAERGAAEFKASLGPSPTLRQVRRGLTEYMHDLTVATREVRREVQRAGVPNTPKGKKIAKGMAEVFGTMRESMAKLEARTERVSVTNRTTAGRQLDALKSRIQDEFDEFGEAFSELQRYDTDGRLDEAFSANPACSFMG